MASLFTKERTIANGTLARLTGRTRQTMIRWHKRVGTRSHENMMLSERKITDTVDPELSERGYRRILVKGEWRLAKQMPNTYQSDIPIAPRGMTKNAMPCSYTERADMRRYFIRPKAFSRAIGRLAEGETVYGQTGKQSDHGVALWQGWTRTYGETIPC
jgi:hypothetical protein